MYAAEAPVVSRAPVAWVVSLSLFSLKASKVFSRGQIETASVASFQNTLNAATVWDNDAVFCMKGRDILESESLKLKSVRSLVKVAKGQKCPVNPAHTQSLFPPFLSLRMLCQLRAFITDYSVQSALSEGKDLRHSLQLSRSCQSSTGPFH